MNRLRSPATLGIACALAGYFLFSAGDAMSKHMRQFDYPATQISFQYSTTAVLLLCLFSPWLGGGEANAANEAQGASCATRCDGCPHPGFKLFRVLQDADG